MGSGSQAFDKDVVTQMGPPGALRDTDFCGVCETSSPLTHMASKEFPHGCSVLLLFLRIFSHFLF